MSAWYLLHCKARQEARAKVNIENQGHRTCFPQISVKKLRRGKRTTVVEPLFPNYLFIQADPNQASFNALRSTRGVNGFVRFGGVPAEVPDAVVQQLEELESQELTQQTQQFSTGSKVQVEEGPFAGLEAVYQLPKGEERCFVLLDILGKQQRIELEERVLRAV